MRSRYSLQTILTGLPVATASLYVIGVCFYQGYMRVMGLEETQFPLAIDRTLFHGFFAVIDLSAPQLGYFVLASELIALIAFIIVLLSTSSKIRLTVGGWLSRIPRKKSKSESLEPPEKITEFASFAGKMFFFAVIILLSILGILLAGVFADKSGQASARSFLKKVSAGQHAAVDVFILGQDQPILAHAILCSNTHCAFLVGKKVVTYRHEMIEKTIAVPSQHLE